MRRAERPATFAAHLRRARRQWLARRLRERLALWAGSALPLLGLLFLVGLCVPPSRTASALLAGAAVLVLGSTFGVHLIAPLLRRSDLSAYALWLERRAGLRRNELANALALERDQARWSGSPVSRDLVALSIARAGERLAALPLSRLHAVTALRPPLTRAALGLLPLLVPALLAPLRAGDAARLFLAAGGAGALPRIELSVTPGSQRVERGEAIEIQARVMGRRQPREVTLAMRRPGGAWNRTAMIPVEAAPEAAPASTAARERHHRFLIPALEDALEYRIDARWRQSPSYTLTMVEPLQAQTYHIAYAPPAYSGLPQRQEVSSRGDLAGLAGTRVTLDVVYRRPGIQGRLLQTDAAQPVALARTASDRLSADWTLRRSGSFQVELSDAATGEHWFSDSFHVEVVPDLVPAVRLVAPEPRLRMPPEMVVELDIDCLDDFGLTELALVYGRAGEDPRRAVLAEWPAAAAVKEMRIRHRWDLEQVQVLPGQELHYYVQVTDNDPLAGPKTAETPLHTIRFPSVAEMYAYAEEDRREEIRSLEETLTHQADLNRQLEQVAQEMLKEDEVSWERQQEVQSLLERQRELAAKVDQVQASLQDSRERMENQNLFSMEVLEKVREIQGLVEEIESSDFHSALERLQHALEDVDRRELQRAMQQMQLSQQEVTTALDRTLEMLRRLLADEQVDRLQQKLNELVARQQELNRQLEQGAQPLPEASATPPEAPEGEMDAEAGASSDLQAEQAGDQPGSQGDDQERPLTPEEQAALAAEQEALQQELDALREELEELARQQAEQLPDLQEALDEMLSDLSSEQTPEQMRQALEAMRQANRKSALKFGRKAEQGLQQMQANMQQMTSSLDIEELERIARALYSIANRLVSASQRQENLLQAVDAHGPRELALYEQQLSEEVTAIGDSLHSVARLTPILGRKHLQAIGAALASVAEARDTFAAGRRSRGVALVGESMRELNGATLALLEAAQQAAQSACPSNCQSPFNQMQTLSMQQQCLNQDTRQMMGSCQTPRLSPSQQQAMMRLAARQEMIRQGLEEIGGDLDASGKLLGDAGRMIEEMEEIVRELERRRADPRLIERQEKILSRLLTAQRSLRKQDEKEERQSETATLQQPRPSPGPVEMGATPAEALRRAMVRGSRDPVPTEYRRMVEAYLQTLMRSR